MLDAMDYQYGRVIEFLKDIGEYDNTIIVFLSDNGANPWHSEEYPDATDPAFQAQFDNGLENIGRPGSNHAYGIGFASNSGSPLDKFKMTAGEGGIRVPLIVAGPGIKAGQQSDAFAYVWDIMSTLLEIADIEYPSVYRGRKVEPTRGRSMLGLLDGSREAIYGGDEFVGGEMAGGRWMRQGNYKAVLVPKPYGTGDWQLFGVVADPGEAKDVAKEMPTKLELLKTAWQQYADEVGVITGN
jgi:arylsulfatase